MPSLHLSRVYELPPNQLVAMPEHPRDTSHPALAYSQLPKAQVMNCLPEGKLGESRHISTLFVAYMNSSFCVFPSRLKSMLLFAPMVFRTSAGTQDQSNGLTAILQDITVVFEILILVGGLYIILVVLERVCQIVQALCFPVIAILRFIGHMAGAPG